MHPFGIRKRRIGPNPEKPPLLLDFERVVQEESGVEEWENQ
jgi:hypothetical protein